MHLFDSLESRPRDSTSRLYGDAFRKHHHNGYISGTRIFNHQLLSGSVLESSERFVHRDRR